MARLPGTALDLRPAAAHLVDGSFALGVARAGEQTHLGEGARRREGLGDGLRGTRALVALEASLPRRRRGVSPAHALERVVHAQKIAAGERLA